MMKRIGFIGAGNMAGAIVKGLLRTGKWSPDDIAASDAADAQLRRLKKLYKIETTRDNRALVRGAKTIVLAVKPQIMAQVLDEIRLESSPKKLFVSIAAGFPLQRLEQGLGRGTRVVRVMPNTPCLIGKGMSVAVAGAHATPADLKETLKLFAACGEAVSITGEALLDAVTALSGSGPAFVYLFAEALSDGGVRGGLSSQLATKLAFQTLTGAAAMLLESGMSPRDLRDMVTSPGGTTLAGLTALDQHGFRDTVIAAIEAATRRAHELAAS
jgi:pyrroline-5-carboxylate reductase